MLVTRLSIKIHTIVALDPSVIILKAKRVGTQKVAQLVRHVHHLIGSAKYIFAKSHIENTKSFCPLLILDGPVLNLPLSSPTKMGIDWVGGAIGIAKSCYYNVEGISGIGNSS